MGSCPQRLETTEIDSDLLVGGLKPLPKRNRQRQGRSRDSVPLSLGYANAGTAFIPENGEGRNPAATDPAAQPWALFFG